MALSRILRKVLVFLGFAFLLITIAVGGFLHFNPLCGEELGIEKTSPDGLYVAQVMTRGCGAMAREVRHINLRPAKSTFHPHFLSAVITDGEVFTTSKYSG